MILFNRLHNLYLSISANLALRFQHLLLRKYWNKGMGLSSQQLISIREILKAKSAPIVLEFGSGRSTEFIETEILRAGGRGQIISYDHDLNYAYSPKSNTSEVRLRSLGTWTDQDAFDSLFVQGWSRPTHPLELAEGFEFRAKNAFYRIRDGELENVFPDLVILDGPNGNGRSAVFPLLANHLKPGSQILIDDLDHYDFKDRMGMIFNVETMLEVRDTQKHPLYSWGLYRVIGRVNESST